MQEISETVEQKKVVRLTHEGIGGLSTELHLVRGKIPEVALGKKEGRKTDDNDQRHSSNTENDRDRI